MLYCLGGNFLRTLPDPDHVEKAMSNVPLRVHQDIILTDQMFIEAKEEVILVRARTRQRHGTRQQPEVSPFVYELPGELLVEEDVEVPRQEKRATQLSLF